MWTTVLMGLLLLIGSVSIHYRGLRLLSTFVEGDWVAPPRARMLLVIFGVLFVHGLEITLYGTAYWLGVEHWGLGQFAGMDEHAFANYMYFSAETFSTLGLGDIYPLGDLRLISSIEALNGLLLLAWSGSFTFLVMQRFWLLHPRRQ